MSKTKAPLTAACTLVVFLSLVLCAAPQVCGAQQTAAENPAPQSATAQDARPAGQTSSPPHLTERYPRYKIAPGDAFDLVFEFSPEFNQSVIVQPDGFITLKDIGDMHLAGDTVPSATERVRTAYEKILANPSISIVLKDFNRPYFIAHGEVGKPGKYELRSDTTVTEGIAIAGGFLPSAKHSQVLLFRHASDEWVEARIINVKKMLKKGELKEDMYLQPGDMLFVRKNAISKIEPILPRSSIAAYAPTF
jgi:polysaccharide export outer membrane protein